eukprot:4561775-Prorocentrum_lima.AAC.1
MNHDPDYMGLLEGPRRQEWIGLNQTSIPPEPPSCWTHPPSAQYLLPGQARDLHGMVAWQQGHRQGVDP